MHYTIYYIYKFAFGPSFHSSCHIRPCFRNYQFQLLPITPFHAFFDQHLFYLSNTTPSTSQEFCIVTCFIRRIATCYCRSYSTSRLGAAMLSEVERTTSHLRLATASTKKMALMSATKSHNLMTAVMKLLTPTPR